MDDPSPRYACCRDVISPLQVPLSGRPDNRFGQSVEVSRLRCRRSLPGCRRCWS